MISYVICKNEKKHVLRGVAQQLAILIRNRWMSSTRQFDPYKRFSLFS